MSRFFGYWNKETQKFEWEKPEAPETPKSANIQIDEIPATEYLGNANREMFTSYAKLKRRCKEDGYEITGGDHLTGKPIEPHLPKSSPSEIREMAERAYYDLKYGRVELSERSKEQCLREERALQQELKRQKTRWA